MKLSEIVKGVKNIKLYPSGADVEISTITKDSRVKVSCGLFFCLRGKDYDGHNFAEESVNNGAVAIVTEKFLPKIKCVQVVVSDVRLCFSLFSASFYNNPQRKMKIIGVVGTNGKTSVANILCDILNFAGKKTACIGTLGVKTPSGSYPSNLTTPDPDFLFKSLNMLALDQTEYVIMELSAHAIWLRKAEAIDFECLIFTNCTHDHLDYFADFSSYREVKKSAFNKHARFFVVNADDLLGREIYETNPKKTLSYGVYNPSDVFAMEIAETLNGTSFLLNAFDMVYAVKTNLLGEFNVLNLLSAVCAGFLCGIKLEKIVKYIESLSCIPGRMEYVGEKNGGKIFIDYAHTPDGLNKSLSFLSSTTERKTYVVFGAGGERDSKKRPKMGKIAGDIADFSIITTDNPRNEDENDIIKDIEDGIKTVTSKYKIIPDRKEAVFYGINLLNKGDALLVAGKGVEEYQEIKGEKIYFSDKKTILEALKN